MSSGTPITLHVSQKFRPKVNKVAAAVALESRGYGFVLAESSLIEDEFVFSVVGFFFAALALETRGYGFVWVSHIDFVFGFVGSSFAEVLLLFVVGFVFCGSAGAAAAGIASTHGQWSPGTSTHKRFQKICKLCPSPVQTFSHSRIGFVFCRSCRNGSRWDSIDPLSVVSRNIYT